MLEIKKLIKTYNNNSDLKIFDGFDLIIKRHEFVSIWGPNGCGKTTLLKIIAGVLPFDSGDVKYNNRDIKTLRTGFVFQDYRNSLFPWMNIRNNISFPLKLKGVGKEIINKRVNKICREFGCNIDLSAYPYELSSGQQQFLSILRGIIIKPVLYLLDEPFSSLDYGTTLSMLEILVEIWLKTKTTIFFISHDIDEAIFLSQKIIILGKRPATVLKIINNYLPYPRKAKILGSQQFAAIKNKILPFVNNNIIN